MLELLMKGDTENKHSEIAEYINQHPDEFRKILDQVFGSETSSNLTVTKKRIIGLVDLLSSGPALDLIERAIHDDDSTIRVRAVKAAYRTRIDSLNEQIARIVKDQEEKFEVRKWMIHILASSDPKAYSNLLRRMARNYEEDVNLRKEAIFALTNMDDDMTIGTLCVLLGDPVTEIRHSGAWALGKISAPSSINCLLAAIEDDDEGVRDWAIRALRDMDDARALQGLADVLKSVEPPEQARMIRLLVEKRSEIILRAIAERLTSPDVNVRREAAWAMSVALFTPSVPSLETLLEDEDERVRYHAKKALLRMGAIFEASDFGLEL
ncbi:MAG: HEAT repeat domain-containing protein [Candidatus Thorarchaeota archaeon]